MRRGLTFFAALTLIALQPLPAQAGALPKKVGQCTFTTLSAIESRLEGVADSGDAVEYVNGGYGVSYERVPGLRGARVGDKIKLCLSSLPSDCPKGDDRGKTYAATDLRTHRSWDLPDAEHMCGGA